MVSSKLHTNMVGPSTIHTVPRGVKGRANRIIIRSPSVQEDYSSYVNAIDRNDRDSADYNISVRTNRYYLRIIFWILQQAIFCCYLIVKQCVKNNLRPEWQKYLSKTGGGGDSKLILECQSSIEELRKTGRHHIIHIINQYG